MDSSGILSEIEAGIGQEDTLCIQPLPADRWIASSAWQKSVRRGNKQDAVRAASAYWRADKRSFWSRLPVVALEDIGAASPNVIVKVLTAAHSPTWRAQVGDLKVALHLTRLMCEAVKIRLADEMFSITGRAPSLQPLRMKLAKSSNEALADLALNSSALLAERALALWLLAGTKRYPSDYLPMRAGSLDAVANVLRSLQTPATLTEACISALPKSPWPLALWTPLLWTEVQKQSELSQVRENQLSLSATLKGIPLIALDQFTRVGKSALRDLRSSIPALLPFTPRQIGLSLFYGEGAKVDRLLTSQHLGEYRQAGEIADVEEAGLTVRQYLDLRGILARHADLLEDIRRRRLRAHLSGEHVS